MAFANEYLTDEAERVKYGSAHVTLDRERDAWLTRSGGGGERPEFIELHWQGEEIKMHAYECKPKTKQIRRLRNRLVNCQNTHSRKIRRAS